MNKKEIDDFIRIMNDVQIDFTPGEVEELYGDLTLKEAITKQLSKINDFYEYVEETVKPEAERLGLWQK